MKDHPKRYSLLAVRPSDVPVRHLISEFRKNLLNIVGERGLARSGIHIVHSERKEQLYVILRSYRDDLKFVQTAALMTEGIYVEVIKVSGTIKKLRKEISEKDF